jgi:hypothetical protein
MSFRSFGAVNGALLRAAFGVGRYPKLPLSVRI